MSLCTSCLATRVVNVVCRRLCRTMTAPKVIDSPSFRALFTPELRKVESLFASRGYELRMAGGAVRDLLMDLTPADVDFATTATPTEMKKLFEDEGIRMLHKRGEEHGTITCRIDDKENFEITTLRIDVVCDGRRAEVQYTTDWQLDANRRDLTVNSLFLKLDGEVVDFFNGVDDLEHRRIRFVGEAATRIQEDYLRILRYFRFFGRLSNTSTHEDSTLKAIVENCDGLKNISAERIWTEMKKIVVGRMAPEVVEIMLRDCKLNRYLGLPDECNLERFRKVFDLYHSRVEPMTMVASLCRLPEQIEEFHKKTKLSNVERLTGEFVLQHRDDALRNIDNEKYWKTLLVDMEVKPGHDARASGRDRVLQLALASCADNKLVEMIDKYELPAFPIKGTDLMTAGVAKGAIMKNTLDYLYGCWKESEFAMPKEELLTHAHDDCIEKPIARTPSLKRKRQNSKGSPTN